MTCEVEACAHDDPVDPGVEALRVTQARQVTPGPDGRFLDRVARELRVPEDESSDPVQPRDAHAEQAREGVMIALPCPLHQASLVHGRPPIGATHVALTRVWRPIRGIRCIPAACIVVGMVSPVPTIVPRELRALDAPVRSLFERVADAVERDAPDMNAIAAALIKLAADHDYLAPRVRAFGDRTGAVGLHVPSRGPRLSLVHRGEGQMGAIHDHGCWVAIAAITGIETHRHFRVTATSDQLARLELITDRAVGPGEAVTMLTGDDIHAHGHVAGRGEAAYVLIMTGDDQRLYRRHEWDAATGRMRVLEPGDGGRWLESQPFPG